MADLFKTSAFVDAHVHLAQTGLMMNGLDLNDVESRDELLQKLESHAARTSDAVILGAGWDETHWPDPTLPTLAELDRAAPGRVVLLSRVDGHSGLVTSGVPSRASAVAEAPGWDGSGRVEREANKQARIAVDGLITRAQRRAAIERALDAAAAAGLGSVHEMAAPHINSATDFELIRELGADSPRIEVVLYWGEHVSEGGVERAVSLGCAGAAGDLNIDGAFGSRTAALQEPYDDAPGHTGHRYLDAEAVAAHVLACTRAGIQAGFHCIGDAGTGAAAEGFRIAAKAVGAERLAALRHRLEHVELVSPEDAGILAECGVVMSVQPAFDAFWGGAFGMYAQRLGTARALAANPFAELREGGLALAFGSDSPVTPFDPWGGVRGAVHHHNAASGVSVAQAFSAHTDGGRYAARQEAFGPDTYAEWEVPGGFGSDGLPDVAPGVPLPRCVRTVVEGRTVYEDPAYEGSAGR